MMWLWLLGCPAEGPEMADSRMEGVIYLSASETTDAIAIRDGRVVAIGADAKAMAVDSVVDLGTQVAVPGFHDAHTHLIPASPHAPSPKVLEGKRIGPVRSRPRPRQLLIDQCKQPLSVLVRTPERR